jgi:hypothetical protein
VGIREELLTLLSGHRVLVLGSAPTVVIPDNYSVEWRLVCVNASGRVAQRYDLGIPALTIVTMGGLRKGGVANLSMRSNLSGLKTKTVLVRSIKAGSIRNLILGYQARAVLAKCGFSYEKCLIGGARDSDAVLSGVLGVNAIKANNISTGVFSVLLAAHSGAEEVAVAGIDPSSTGHAYDDKGLNRQHVRADQEVIDLLQADRRFTFHAKRSPASQ